METIHHLLIVEDDPDLISVIRFYLAEHPEYKVTAVGSAEAALEVTQSAIFDIILMDIMLPQINGIDLCMQLRKNIFCPIIFISCLDDEATIVKALRMGGDDYLVKPFKGPVLLARIEANLRRLHKEVGRTQQYLKNGNLMLDISAHMVHVDEKQIYLSPTEFEILFYMMNHANEVLEMEQIYFYIWHRPSYGDVRTVSVHISNIRKKIEKNPNIPTHIKTVRRIGYMFCAQ